jgi:EpsI family protein
MLSMMWVGLKFRDPDAPPAAAAVAPETGRTAFPAVAVGLAALLVAAAAPAYGYWLDHRQPDHKPAIAAPTAKAPWRASPETNDNWRPTFAGADGELLQAYVGPNGPVYLYIAYYASQRYGAKIISTQNRIEDEKTWRRASSGSALATIDGHAMPVAKQIMSIGDARRVAWYFYWVDGRLTASSMKAKLFGARGTLLSGHPEAAVVVIATDVTGTEEEAARRIQDFLDHLQPVAPFLGRLAAR